MAVEALNNIQNLDFKKKLAFAYLACERLFPNYVVFHENYNFGNPAFLRQVIDFIQETIFSEKADTHTAQKLLDSLNQYIPEPADHDTILASSALDTCTVIEASLHFILKADNEMLEQISVMATDSVHMYIQERDDLDYNTDKNFDRKIMNDALMKRELKIQNGIIAFLNKIGNITEADLTTLLQLQDNKGKGNLGI